MASSRGYSEIVEMLLKAGANPSSVNEMVIYTCTLTFMYIDNWKV